MNVCAGACCDLQDKSGQTAILLAALNGHTQIVQVLLQHGANPDIPATKGNTPLLGTSYLCFIPGIRIVPITNGRYISLTAICTNEALG